MAKKKAKKKPKKRSKNTFRQKVYFALDRGFDSDPLFEGMGEARDISASEYEEVIEKEVFGGELNRTSGERIRQVADDMWEDHVSVEGTPYTRGMQDLAEEIKRNPDIVEDEDEMRDFANAAIRGYRGLGRDDNPSTGPGVAPRTGTSLKSKLLR